MASRATIHDRLDELRILGYQIQDYPNRGFQLCGSPDRLIPDDIGARLRVRSERAGKSLEIGNRVMVYEETASTNDLVQKLGIQGHPPGLVVFAETQSKGRGRHGRTWESPSRKGLWFSILVEPRMAPEFLSRYTVMAAVAVAESLHRMTQLPLKIKWPNDILCRGKKVGGILLEWVSGETPFVVIGIGINVNLKKDDFRPELVSKATSLLLEGEKFYHRPSLAEDLLWTLNLYQDGRVENDFSSLLNQWIERDDTLGRQVRVLRSDGSAFLGNASHLDPDGALLVRRDDGSLERVVAGDVSLNEELRN
jgi:BirA family biotin operon repressor/biotin-[acetyl-CoA-carboxylase] ligase